MTFDQPWQLAMFEKTLKKKMKVNLIKKHLGQLSAARALMISCGDNNGAMNYHLRAGGGEWTWADFESGSISQVEELLGEPVEKLDKKSTLLPFEDGTFDRIVVVDCHEHLEEPLAFTKELRRITRPDGRVVISVPNGDERMLAVRIKNLVGMTKETYGHLVVGYDVPDLEKMLEQSDLQPTGVSTYSKFFTEMLELVINFYYVKLAAKKGEVEVEEGTIAPSTREQLKKVEKIYKLYRLVYPLFRAISWLDQLLFFTKGYAIVMEAVPPEPAP